MNGRLAASCLLVLLPAVAAAEEADDPAFARKGGAPYEPWVAEDEPFPEAAPDARAAVPGPAARVEARHEPRVPAALQEKTGIGMRVGLRVLKIQEPSGPPDASFAQPFESQWFDGFGFDVYPISSTFRLGLNLEYARQRDQGDGGGDWLVTEGVLVGWQMPGRRLTPYVEAGAHSGLGNRTFIFDEPIIGTVYEDFLTIFWSFTGEVGVDWRAWGRFTMSAGLGIQHTSYFYAAGDPDNQLLVHPHTTATFKFGLGY